VPAPTVAVAVWAAAGAAAVRHNPETATAVRASHAERTGLIAPSKNPPFVIVDLLRTRGVSDVSTSRASFWSGSPPDRHFNPCGLACGSPKGVTVAVVERLCLVGGALSAA
jgi:hypothetical protein